MTRDQRGKWEAIIIREENFPTRYIIRNVFQFFTHFYGSIVNTELIKWLNGNYENFW